MTLLRVEWLRGQLVTGRTDEKRELALRLGAHQVFDSNGKLPGKVAAVFETVGEATWKHSVRSLVPGGTIVCSGATSGNQPPAELAQMFFLPSFPLWSLTIIAIDIVAIYGLCIAGDRRGVEA